MRYRFENRADSNLILLMSLIYSSIIIFPAYGPILGLYTNASTCVVLSTLFLFVFAAAIFTMPVISLRLNDKLWKFICLATIIMILLFPAFNFQIQSLAMIFAGLFTAKMVLLWSASYLSIQPAVSYGDFFTSILFLSYAILYFFNVVSPNLPKQIAIFFPAAFFSLLFIFSGSKMKSLPKIPSSGSRAPTKYLVPIFIIYISAGITYSGIYPLISKFSVYERFYNVLPFLAALPFVLWVHKKRGVKALLWTGISLLGFSFLFHIYELTVWNYVVIQTLLQSGWAFMNSFVWLFASNIARINRNPYYFSSAIATFLMGTALGSAIFILVSMVVPSANMTFLGLLPLIGVLVFTQMIPDDLKKDIETFEATHLEVLTYREKEIFLMLLENMKNKDIAEHLNISPNTLKKHCGSIYRKLYIENKTELIKVYGNMKKA